jgi:hypothetical protein
LILFRRFFRPGVTAIFHPGDRVFLEGRADITRLATKVKVKDFPEDFLRLDCA